MPLSLQDQLGHRLRLRSTRLALQIVARQQHAGENEPKLTADQRRRHARCVEDVGFHIQFLIASVEQDDPRIFADYIAWAADLLSRYHIPRAAVAANVRAIHEVLAESLPPDDAARISPHTDAALRRLAAG